MLRPPDGQASFPCTLPAATHTNRPNAAIGSREFLRPESGRELYQTDQSTEGRLDASKIDEEQFGSFLYTAGLPDPDLLIRTAGEHRLSNFLLWQISYTEIYVSGVLWPDFGVEHLNEAIRDYAARERRYGDLPTRVELDKQVK